MTDITRNLTIKVNTPHGQELIEGAAIEVKLTRADYTEEGVMFPRTYEAETDENGSAVLSLVPNDAGTQSSQYQITVYDTDGSRMLRELITMPDQDSTLSDLVDSVPTSSQSAAQLAMLTANNAVSTASASATAAATSATEAETAKTAAELAETNAETAQTNAETAESSAAASATAAAASATSASAYDTSAETYAAAAEAAKNSAESFASSAASAATNAIAAFLFTTGISNASPVLAIDAAGTGTVEVVQVSASNDVVLGDATQDTVIRGGTTTIIGDLVITGNQVSVDSNTVNIGDSIITLNSDEVGTPSQNAGFEVERGTSANVSFLWDESNARWFIDQPFYTSEKFRSGISGGVVTNNELVAIDGTAPLGVSGDSSVYASISIKQSTAQASGGNHIGYFDSSGTERGTVGIDASSRIYHTGAQAFSGDIEAGGDLNVIGTVGIGTPASAKALDIRSNAAEHIVDFRNASASGFGAVVYAASGSNYSLFVADYLGNPRFRVNGDGESTFSNSVNAANYNSDGSTNPYYRLNDGTYTSFLEVDTGNLRATHNSNIVWAADTSGVMYTPNGIYMDGEMRFNEGGGAVNNFKQYYGANFWNQYHNSDNSFRLNYNNAGNDEFNLSSSGVLTLTTNAEKYNQLVLTQAGSNPTLYSYADNGGVGWATGAEGSYGELIYMRRATGEIAIYADSTLSMEIESLQTTVYGKLKVTGLPTSSAGLSSGELWRDGTDVKVVI